MFDSLFFHCLSWREHIIFPGALLPFAKKQKYLSILRTETAHFFVTLAENALKSPLSIRKTAGVLDR